MLKDETKEGCGCVYLLHWNTANRITVVKWCSQHRPLNSLTGKSRKDSNK